MKAELSLTISLPLTFAFSMFYESILQRLQIDNEYAELFIPKEEAVQELYAQGKISFPYWSKIWPSAIAISKFLVRHPNYIQEKTVVELAAGLGLPSLVIAKKATQVICSDYDADAVAIVQNSIELNGLQNVEARQLDWRHLPDGLTADVLLLSDVNYEPTLFDQQLEVIFRFLKNGSTIILATPQRLMAKDFIASLLIYVIDKQDIAVEEKGKEVTIFVFVLKA